MYPLGVRTYPLGVRTYPLGLKKLTAVFVECGNKMGSAYANLHPGNSYIECSFAEKETAKQMGAKWDPIKKMWYVPPGKNVHPFFIKWKTHCRRCNAILLCETSKGGRPCENTEDGMCCEYDWSGKSHCEYS